MLVVVLLVAFVAYYYGTTAEQGTVSSLNALNAQENSTISSLNSQVSSMSNQISSYQTEVGLQDSIAVLDNATISLSPSQTYAATNYNAPHSGFLKISVETPLVTPVCFYDYTGYGYSVYTYVEGSYNGVTYHVDVANGTLSPYYMAVLPGSVTVYLQSDNPCETQTLYISVTFDGQ